MQAYPIRVGSYGDETTILETVERVEAKDIKPGDYVARSRNAIFQHVLAVTPNDVSVWINYHRGGRDRPAKTARWWRATDPAELAVRVGHHILRELAHNPGLVDDPAAPAA